MKYITLVLFGIISTIWEGYVLSIVWSWFIASKFDLPELGVVSAIGLIMVAKFVTFAYIPAYKKSDDQATFLQIVESVTFRVTYSTITLGVGWIVHQFA